MRSGLRSRFSRRRRIVVAGVVGTARCAVQAPLPARPRSTYRALEKLVQRLGGGEDRPGRNRGDDGKEQRLNSKFPTLFAREITSG